MTLPPDLHRNRSCDFPSLEGSAAFIAKHGRDGMRSQDADNRETFWPKKEVNSYCPNM